VRSTDRRHPLVPLQLDQQPLLAIRPEDTLHTVAHTLLRSGYKSVPILSYAPSADDSGNDLDPATAAPQHEVSPLYTPQ
jgi:hypothetical protein